MSKHRKRQTVFIFSGDKNDLTVVNRGRRDHHRHHYESHSSCSSNSTCESSSSSSSSRSSSSHEHSSSSGHDERPVIEQHSGSSSVYKHSSSSDSSSSHGQTGPTNQAILFWNSGRESINTESPYVGWGFTSDTAAMTSIIVPHDGTLANLYAQLPGNSGCTGTVTVYVNASETTISVTGTGVSLSDTVNTVPVYAGDLVTVYGELDAQCISSVIASVELNN